MVKKRGRWERKESDKSDSDDELYGLDEPENFFDNSQKRSEVISDEEVYGFGDSDDSDGDGHIDEKDGENEANDYFDMGSDIEEKNDNLPDERAWGKKNRRFYYTDYVDQDYEGFYQGKEAEEAELEEQEARQIQKRLAEQLNEADFIIPKPATVQTTSEHDTFETIETDVSALSSREKLDLLKKESPEFFILVDDFKSKLIEIKDELLPVLNHIKKRQEVVSVVEFLQKRFLLLMNYFTNISFYLLLKAKRISVRNHPVLKSLYHYQKLLEEIDGINNIIKPQIQNVLQLMKEDEKILDKTDSVSHEKEKSILKLLSKANLKKINESNVSKETNGKKSKESEVSNDTEMDVDSDKNEMTINNINANESQTTKPEEKRAITYEMAKNKGLMPKRNKDQRNPRVKHRKKYRKALIRRRGQVRTARKEIPVYGGEPTGIKVGVTKSIKFK